MFYCFLLYNDKSIRVNCFDFVLTRKSDNSGMSSAILSFGKRITQLYVVPQLLFSHLYCAKVCGKRMSTLCEWLCGANPLTSPNAANL